MSTVNSNISILIVDDKPEKVLSLEAVLDDLHENVVRAYSGREALRHVLAQEFAVILLDVNMPGMDGFETAKLIRQRQSSAHVPIIFLTAMSDEIHAARGYSLGAVDYILMPVVPDVLRSKVAVFVDLFRKNQQVRLQAERLRQRAAQLHRLTAASLAINSADSVQKIVEIVTQTARDLIGVGQAVTIASPGSYSAHNTSCAIYADEDQSRRSTPPRIEDHGIYGEICRSNKFVRLSPAELAEHDLAVGGEPRSPIPLQGLLAAPLTNRDGKNIGLISLSQKEEGAFTEDDEAVLVQLSQMTSLAIENVIYAEEREANRLKDEFLSTLSHELRTPLNAISGWVHLLKMGSTPEDLSRGLRVIDQNVKAQTKLIEDLLDLSRITTGKLRLHLRPVALRRIVNAAIDALRPLLRDKRIELQSQFDTGDFIVRGDADRLEQVFNNLLGNALKFTRAGGQITVQLQYDGGVATCRISDTGDGIDPAFLPYVFDRFRQADSTSSRGHGGLGIGLTIVKQIVGLHGGTVQAQSDGKGRGSTFTVALPMAALLPDSQELDGPREDHNEAPPTLRDLRILVVDDEPDARDVIAHLLGRSEAEVSTASSAAEAMSLVPRYRPDVLVTDLAMPEQDGFELLRQLRRLPEEEGGNTPAIALTAYAQLKEHTRAIASGFLAHIVKPVNPTELVNAVRRCVPHPVDVSSPTNMDTRSPNPERITAEPPRTP